MDLNSIFPSLSRNLNGDNPYPPISPGNLFNSNGREGMNLQPVPLMSLDARGLDSRTIVRGPLPVTPYQNPLSLGLFDKGMGLIKAGNKNEGIKVFSQIYSNSSEYKSLSGCEQVKLMVTLGINAYREKRYDQARELLSKAKERNSFNSQKISHEEKTYCLFYWWQLQGEGKNKEIQVLDKIAECHECLNTFLQPNERKEVLFVLVNYYVLEALNSHLKVDKIVEKAFDYCRRIEDLAKVYPDLEIDLGLERFYEFNIFLAVYYNNKEGGLLLKFEYAKRALAVFPDDGRKTWVPIGLIHSFLADMYRSGMLIGEILVIQDFDLALKHYLAYEKSEDFAKLEEMSKGKCYSEIADAAYRLSKLKRHTSMDDSYMAYKYAQKVYEIVLRQAHNQGDAMLVFKSELFLARTAYSSYRLMKDRNAVVYKHASVAYEHMHLLKSDMDPYGQAIICTYLGLSYALGVATDDDGYVELMNPEESFNFLKRGCEIIDKYNIDAMDPKLFSEAFQVLASWYREKGDVEQADYCEQRCWDIWGLVNN